MIIQNLKLNIVFLCVLCDRAESLPKEDGQVFNIRANSCSFVVQMGNIRQFPGKPNAKNLISRNEPNFSNQASTLTYEITRNYNRSHRNHHPKNEPNTNPIRTQYEPNSNPIRTQSKPNQSQFHPTKTEGNMIKYYLSVAGGYR